MLNEFAKSSLDEIDFDTGFPNPDFHDQDHLEASTAVLERSGLFHELKQTPGWQILEKYLQEEVAILVDQLKIEEDISKMKRIQALVCAFEFLPQILEKALADAERARQQIDQYIKGSTPLG